MKSYILLFTLFFVLISCKQEPSINAQSIIDEAIVVAGGDKFNKFDLDFDFRGIHYKATRNNGKFSLERHIKDSLNIFKDIINNDGYKRYVNNYGIVVADSMVPRFIASVNSVHYFSVLPYGLNAPAVNKEYLGDKILKGKNYHKIRVTFNQQGGGEDFEDVFTYWVNVESKKVDYLAYSYDEDDGKGLRFREAYNERIVEGIRFVDYNNYKPKDESVSVTSLDELFEQDKLKLLSKIELENIRVKL